jgi:hypothetical protein
MKWDIRAVAEILQLSIEQEEAFEDACRSRTQRLPRRDAINMLMRQLPLGTRMNVKTYALVYKLVERIIG